MYQGLSLDQAPPLSVPLRFFLTAPAFGVLGGLALALGGAELWAVPLAGPAIAWVHLWTLGWLAMVMVGAFYQMIPVMIGGQVPWGFLSKWVHGLLVVGVLGLVGFFQFWVPFLGWIGWTALGVGLGLFLAQTSLALWRVKGEVRPTLSAMRLSLGSLAIVWVLGLARLVEHLGGPGLPGPIRELHLMFGLVGWVGLLFLGVSFHLVPMFYVCPPIDSKTAFGLIRLIGFSLALTTLALASGVEGPWLLSTGALGVVGFWGYGIKMSRLVRQRRRKKIDPALGAVRVGFAWLSLASGLFVAGHLGLERALDGAGLVMLLGFGLSFTHGMLYKILPFLVWFHRFSSQIGQPGVPLLGDILPQPRMWADCALLQLSLVLLLLGCLFPPSGLLETAGLTLALGHGYLGVVLLKSAGTVIPPQP